MQARHRVVCFVSPICKACSAITDTPSYIYIYVTSEKCIFYNEYWRKIIIKVIMFSLSDFLDTV